MKYVIITGVMAATILIAGCGKKSQAVRADETTRMVHFQTVQVSVVLPIYQSLTGLELIIDSRAKQVNSTITVKSPEPLNDADAAKFIEKALLTQAAIVITRLDDKRASVTYNDALTTTP